VSANERER